MTSGKAIIIVSLATCGLVGGLIAADFWQTKDFGDWTEKECMSLLNSSPWAFSQTVYKGAQFTMTPNPNPTPGELSAGGMTSQRETKITFRFRCLTAKPIRMAFARLAMLNNVNKNGAKEEFLRMIESSPEASDRVMIEVDFEVDPSGDAAVRDIHSFLQRANFSHFRDNTRLETSTKRIADLAEYFAPGRQRARAMFVFPRKDKDGNPIFTGDETWISLKTLIAGNNLRFRFKAEKMKFQNTFEF